MLTPAEWDEAIRLHFFSKEHSGSTQPIRYIQADEQSLVMAAARVAPSVSASSAITSFRASFRPKTTRNVLAGQFLPTTGFFPYARYLLLTLHVESALDDDDEGAGAFRGKLSEFLGGVLQFSDLSGVNQRWKEFAEWLNERSSQDPDLRLLQLPDYPAGWNQIGIAKRLVFPAKRDFNALRTIVGPDLSLWDEPQRLLHRLHAHPRLSSTSVAFQSAFEEFRREYQAGRRALAETDFWRFVAAATPETRDPGQAVGLREVLAYQSEDSWDFALSDPDGVSASVVGALGELLNDLPTADRPQGWRDGLIVFMPSGYGEWRAVRDWGNCVGQVRFALRADVASRANLLRTIPSGGWVFNRDTTAFGRVEELARRLGMDTEPSGRVEQIEIRDAVRTAGQLLSTPWLLPTIGLERSALEIKALQIKPVGATVGLVGTQDGNGTSMSCETSFEGLVDLAAGGEAGKRAPFWSRRLRFVAEAFEHHESVPGGATASWSVLHDLDAAITLGAAPVPKSDVDGEAYLDEAVEAVYAVGRTGIPEGELIRLLSRAPTSGTSPWTLLRLLHHSSIIAPRLRPHWGGIDWTLEPPLIEVVRSGQTTMVVASGALTRRMRDRFANEVNARGGASIFRRAGPVGATLVAGANVDPAEIASRLGWRIRDTATDRGSGKPVVVERTTGGLSPGHAWSWERLAFVPASTLERPRDYDLVRCFHPEGRFHSVYAVGHGASQRRTLSLSSAFVLAARRRKSALFEWRSGILSPTKPAALLPVEAARSLRLRHFTNAGATGDIINYRCDLAALRGLSQALGPIIRSVDEHSARQAFAGGHRRSRPLWNAAENGVVWARTLGGQR